MTTESDLKEQRAQRAQDMVDRVQPRADVIYGFIETMEQTALLFGLDTLELEVALSMKLGSVVTTAPDHQVEAGALYALILGAAQRARENNTHVPNHRGSDTPQ